MGLVGQGARALLCGTAAFVLAGSMIARAQEAENAAPDEQVTTEDQKQGRATGLKRIVLGAGQEKVAIDTPSAVTVVEQQEIDDEQPQTINEIVKNIPGVNATGSDRLLGQSFNIRGVGAPENTGDGGRIIVNVDGVQKFYEQYRMGSFFSDPELYKRVEVLRGPAFSTLYGSGALGGVVNFTTKDASDFIAEGDTGALRLKTAWDSNGNGWLFNSTLAQRMGDNAEFLLSGNYRFADVFRTGNGTPLLGTNFRAWSGLAKGTFKVGDEGTLRLSYQRFDSNLDRQHLSQTSFSPTFGLIDRYVVDNTAIVSYENPFTDNDMLDLKIQASYSDTSNSQRNADLRAFCSPGNYAIVCDSDYAYKTWQLNAQNTSEWRGDNWENFLTAGAQFAYQTRIANSYFNSGALFPVTFHPEGSDVKAGVFVQNEFIWDDRLTLIPGVRLDWHELSPNTGTAMPSSDDTAISPKLAAQYKFNDTVSVFGSIAHTERFPTLDEMFTTSSSSSTFNPSPDLRKERSNNFEAGFALNGMDLVQSGDSAQIKVTGFYNKVKDLIALNPALVGPPPGPPGPPVYNNMPGFVNINSATIYGFEVEAAYDSDYVFANAGYSYLIGTNDRATNARDKYLSTIAPHELSLTIGGKLPEQGVRFGWRSRFVAGATDPLRDRNSPPPHDRRTTRFASSFDVHDVFVSWKPEDGPLKGWEGNFGIDNIFDRQYKEFLQNDVAKGRTFKLALTKQFGW